MINDGKETHLLLTSKWATVDSCYADNMKIARKLFEILGYEKDDWLYIVEIKTGQIERY